MLHVNSQEERNKVLKQLKLRFVLRGFKIYSLLRVIHVIIYKPFKRRTKAVDFSSNCKS